MQNVVVFDCDYLSGKAIESIVNKNPNFNVVAIVRSVQELLAKLDEQRVELLFMDVMYTSVPNFDLLALLKEGYKSTAVVIISAYNNYDYMRNTMKYGVEDYLVKPITIMKINEILHFKQQISSKNNKTIEVIRSLVKNRNFSDVYYSIEDLRAMLQEEIEDTKSEENVLNSISEEVFRLINCLNEKNQKHVYTKLKFEEISVYNKYPTQFFLFNLFDEIYKQRTIQKKPQLSQFYDYVDANIYQDISLNETAEMCDISQGYLSRILKENYSIGFNTYIQMKKTQLAKQGFYYNDSKIIDISFQLSFSEPSYFCKVFKKIEKITPLQLKKEMIKRG